MQTEHQLTIAQKFGFILGWLFFGLAFLLAAAESTLGRGFITSTNDLLLAMEPGKWIAFKARYASFFFDHVVLTLLELPGWFLAGLPAGFLLWTCRPHRENVDPELYDSLTTIDRLAALADEEKAQNDDPRFIELMMGEEEELTPELLRELQNSHFEPDSDKRFIKPAQSSYDKMDESRDNLSIPFDKLS